MGRWLMIGLLLLGTATVAGCDSGDDDQDVADVGDETDRAGDGNWEDGDGQEVRDHFE